MSARNADSWGIPRAQCQDLGNTFWDMRWSADAGRWVPWKETQLEKIREEFVLRALEPEAKFVELCREQAIRRKTAYKWIAPFKARGVAELEDLSRCQHSSPIRAIGRAGAAIH